jgi:Zn-dependent peptidase ImmA (M78 family)/DNA-binding XRE family transcriptional regulator
VKRGTPVPITGSVLRWALRESGFSEEEIATHLKVDIPTLQRWEKGKDHPRLTEFKQLAQLLKRPTAIFFLPEPPSESVPRPAFRATPGTGRAGLLPAELIAIRRASRIQDAVAWILEELDRPEVSLPTAGGLATAAVEVREFLGVTVAAQREWPNVPHAVRRWRDALESKGILVFVFRMGEKACRGFSLWNTRAPVVVINSAYNAAARVFTLFHELAHLLTRKDSVCIGSPVTAQADAYERRCEEFAADFLLPEPPLQSALSEYQARHRGGGVDVDTVRWVANVFKVSLRATAFTLVRRSYSSWPLYEKIDEIAKTDTDKGGGGGGGERRPDRRAREYGKRATGLLLRAADEGLLGRHDLADYLEVRPSELDEIRNKLE